MVAVINPGLQALERGINMLCNLARYTYTCQHFFEPLQYIAGNGTSIHVGTDSAISALLTVSRAPMTS